MTECAKKMLNKPLRRQVETRGLYQFTQTRHAQFSFTQQ